MGGGGGILPSGIPGDSQSLDSENNTLRWEGEGGEEGLGEKYCLHLYTCYFRTIKNYLYMRIREYQ